MIKTTGDMRKFLANLALGVAQGDTKTDQAAVAIKACKEINSSLYSEIKASEAARERGEELSKLGDLPIG